MKAFGEETLVNSMALPIPAPIAKRIPAPFPSHPLEPTDVRPKPARRDWAGCKQLLALAVGELALEIIVLSSVIRTEMRKALITQATMPERFDVGRVIIGTASAYIAAIATPIVLEI